MRYAWATSVAIVLSVGLGGLPLCWWWACDDYSAGLVANRLLRSGNSTRSGAQRQETLDPENEPGASWWRSTAAHMSLWAMSLDRASSDPDRAEQVRFFLQAARTSSPVQATARYALAQLRHGTSQETALFESLGLSRDVVSLTWKGRCLLGAGKTEAALRAYGEALEMAARADLAELERPTFSRDQQLTRYLLPYESLMGPVIRELADAHEWTFTDWSTALPACAVAPLAASGVLKQLGRSAEAEKALDLALVQAQQPPLPGCSTAVHLAAEAEALALRNHWQEAAERYRQAIDLMTHDAIRRSWWVNLADIYGHLHDDPKKRAAWEAAKATDPNDEITRRVVRSQTEAGIGVSNDGTARRSLVGGQPPTSGRDPTPSERTARGPEP